MDNQYLAFYQTVGARIREIRVSKGMTQADLAEKAHLSLPAVSDIENARSKMWLITFARIAEALQVSADDILRLNTPASAASYPVEFAEILEGCTSAEIESLLKIVKQVKATFQEQKKDYLD